MTYVIEGLSKATDGGATLAGAGETPGFADATAEKAYYAKQANDAQIPKVSDAAGCCFEPRNPCPDPRCPICRPRLAALHNRRQDAILSAKAYTAEATNQLRTAERLRRQIEILEKNPGADELLEFLELQQQR